MSFCVNEVSEEPPGDPSPHKAGLRMLALLAFFTQLLANRSEKEDNMRKVYLFFVIIFSLTISNVHAGWLQDAANWWQVRSVNSVAKAEEQPEPESEPIEEDDDQGDEGDVSNSEPRSISTGEAGKCIVPRQTETNVCDLNSGFLCLNTPEPGVDQEYIIIKGTINKSETTPASINVSIQNEYTKETYNIDTGERSTADCWNSNLENKPFCLSQDGYYAARLPLDKYGPYTVSISASRFSGSSETVSGRTSKVKSFTLDQDQIIFDPDITQQELVEDSHVIVSIDLLQDCQNCDFIGASTQAVTITVENKMQDGSGNNSTISCQSSVEQGGQGNFEVGVPVNPGSNELTITACNPAIDQAECPTISGISFQGSGAALGLEIISPAESLPIYSKENYPENIPFEFKLSGVEKSACVKLVFNRDQPQDVCGSSEGIYQTNIVPQTGINIVTIEHDDSGFSQAWVFGWGKVNSPFVDNNEINDGLVSESALQLILASKTIKNTIVPFISNYLGSDEFQILVEDVTANLGKSAKEEQGGERDKQDVPIDIPQCSGESTFQDFSFTLMGEPQIGSAQIEHTNFAKDILSLDISFQDLGFVIGLIKKDVEGKTVLGPIPLRISFSEALLFLELKVEQEEGLILLSSPYTDCDFKKDKYCEGTPAALIPQNFVGNATDYGFFVKCDTSGFNVSEEVQDLCHSFNELDNQTGLISEAVLDAINSTLYCAGSEFASKFAQNGLKHTLSISGQGVLDDFNLPLGVKLNNKSDIGLKLNSNGLMLDAGLIIGNQDTFSDLPTELQIPSIGVISEVSNPVFESVENNDKTLQLALGTDALNHLLFLASAVGVDGADEYTGLVDIKLSEVSFAELGFDFKQECDHLEEGEEASTLCLIRPRVSEMLDSLPPYGYFESNQPIMMRIQGSRVLAPHLSLVSPEQIPPLISSDEESSSESLSDNLLDVQIGGLRISFYALEIDQSQEPDEFGNYPLLLDEQGQPVIHSMLPNVADPWQGQIASFELAILLAVEVGEIQTNPENPDEFLLTIRPLGNRTRLVISPIPGTNTTTVPGTAIISSLYEKAQIALNMFSDPEKAFRIPIPKSVELFSSEAEEFEFFGLQKIVFTENGLEMGFNSEKQAITLDLKFWLRQMLHYLGEQEVFELNKAS